MNIRVHERIHHSCMHIPCISSLERVETSPRKCRDIRILAAEWRTSPCQPDSRKPFRREENCRSEGRKAGSGSGLATTYTTTTRERRSMNSGLESAQWSGRELYREGPCVSLAHSFRPRKHLSESSSGQLPRIVSQSGQEQTNL